MARRLHIPGLVTLLELTDDHEIRRLDADPRIDRGLEPRGGLLIRLRLSRLATAFVFDGKPLPAFLSRHDVDRQHQRDRLAVRLDELASAGSWSTDPAFDILVGAVVGSGANGQDADEVEKVVGPAAQGLVGRLFDAGYRSDEESYDAARLLNDYPRAGLPRSLAYRVSGRVGRARRLLSERASGDGHTLHATTIAVHNLVRSLLAMRQLLARDPLAHSMPAEVALSRCMAAPAMMLRRVDAPLTTPASPRRLMPGDLVVFRVEECVQATGDLDRAFMADSWAHCPAQRFILSLLGAIWTRALDTNARETSS